MAGMGQSPVKPEPPAPQPLEPAGGGERALLLDTSAGSPPAVSTDHANDPSGEGEGSKDESAVPASMVESATQPAVGTTVEPAASSVVDDAVEDKEKSVHTVFKEARDKLKAMPQLKELFHQARTHLSPHPSHSTPTTHPSPHPRSVCQ